MYNKRMLIVYILALALLWALASVVMAQEPTHPPPGERPTPTPTPKPEGYFFPTLQAKCTGPIHAGKYCEVRVFQHPEDFVILSTEGDHQPVYWTPFVVETDSLLIWGISWHTEPLDCKAIHLAHIDLMRKGMRIIEAIDLWSHCYTIPEVTK